MVEHSPPGLSPWERCLGGREKILAPEVLEATVMGLRALETTVRGPKVLGVYVLAPEVLGAEIVVPGVLGVETVAAEVVLDLIGGNARPRRRLLAMP